MRRTIRSRFCSSVRGTAVLAIPPTRSRSCGLPHGFALDPLLVLLSLENRVHIEARRVHAVGVELTKLDQLFHLGNDVVGGGGHHRVEVAGGLAINEVAPAVALPSFDEGEIPANAAFHHVLAAFEFAGL